jgi:hypothetical protein
MKILLSTITLLLSFTFIFCQDTLRHHVLFDSDKSKINDAEIEQLNKFMHKHHGLKITEVIVIGHTDSDGNQDYNLLLSKSRVDNVAEYLNNKYGLSSEKAHFGKTKPLNTNSSEREKEENRRVELTLVVEKDDTVSHYTEYTLSDLYADLTSEYQTYCIDPNKDTILRLQQGTLLNIPAKSFKAEDSCILIKAKEVYTYADMFMENLTTTSQGRQLESGGMIYLEAADQSGKNLNLEQRIAVFMPSQDFQEGMKVFYGERDGHEAIDWQLEDRSESNRMIGFSFSNNGPFLPPIDLGKQCKFFWCKIGFALRSVGGVFSREIRYSNIAMKNQYRQSEEIRNLMDSLGITNYEELYAHMQKERNKEIENKVKDGKVSIHDLSYYAFSTSKLGWMNCDKFKNTAPKINMDTPIVQEDNIDVKLFFTSFKSIMPPNSTVPHLSFRAIKEGEKVHYIAVKTRQGKVYLSMLTTKTSLKAPELEFEEVTLEELKAKIQKLNG